jgi:23S rRNA (guanosine2251-2'-O)-methyltransferase
VTPPRGASRRPAGGGGGGGGSKGRTGGGSAGGARGPARGAGGRGGAGAGAGGDGARRGRPGRPEQREPSELGGDQVEGRRAVLELLTVGRRTVRQILLAEDQDPSPQLDRIEELAARLRIPVETVPRHRLDAQARTEAPQGVLAIARPIEPVSLEDLCTPSRKGVQPFLLVAAGITDPRNLGALLRSAECAGVNGVVLPRHRSARLSPTVAKTAAGAIEHLPFAVVGGIPAALSQMTDLGVWSVGLAGESSQSLYDLPLGEGPIALVVGSEEKGLAPLVRRRCDAVVSIPQHGSLPSLNVGVAGAVAAFEVARQRSQAGR